MRKLGDIGPYQQMEMGIQQSSGETLRLGFGKQAGKAGEELFAILIIEKNRMLFNPSEDDMMQEAGEIYAGLSGRGGEDSVGIYIYQEPPHCSPIQVHPPVIAGKHRSFVAMETV